MDPDFEPSSPSWPIREGFRFTGSGGEYFRIWIVNVALTLLTLGIYSAWAKVRRLQYFHRHTEVAGASFDYHGEPVSILLGRIVALALLVAYSVSNKISVTAAFVTLFVLAAVLPWLLRNSLRFRLRYSSYRGLRFSFHASSARAYATFLPFGVLAFMALGLSAWAFHGQAVHDPRLLDQHKAAIYGAASGIIFLVYLVFIPLLHQRLKRFQHGRSWFGQTPFSFSATPGRFFATYGLALLVMLGLLFVLGLVLGVTGGMIKAAKPGRAALLLFVPIYLLSFAVVTAFFTSRIGNLVWNSTKLGEHRFASTMRFGPLLGIQAANILLVVFTVGLYMPWAMVKMARYRADNLALLPASPVEEFLAGEEQGVGAVGAETLEMFDFDIAL